jgi:hypothetical protein
MLIRMPRWQPAAKLSIRHPYGCVFTRPSGALRFDWAGQAIVWGVSWDFDHTSPIVYLSHWRLDEPPQQP